MEILYLIGGNGFIGKNIAKKLNSFYHIYIFDKYIDSDFFSTYENIELVIIDLEKEIIPNNYPSPNYILNLASIVTTESNLDLFNELIKSNLNILLNIYERFSKDPSLKIYVHFGSIEEYGNQKSIFKENMRENPNSPYGLIKQLTVNTSLMLYSNYNFPICIIRPSNLFGPYQGKNKFIPYIIRSLLCEDVLELTKCEQKRDFIYIDDFTSIIHKLLINYEKCLGEIINIGSGNINSLKSIVEFIKVKTQSKTQVLYGKIPYKRNEIFTLECSIEKLSKILNEDIEIKFWDRLLKYIKNYQL